MSILDEQVFEFDEWGIAIAPRDIPSPSDNEIADVIGNNSISHTLDVVTRYAHYQASITGKKYYPELHSDSYRIAKVAGDILLFIEIGDRHKKYYRNDKNISYVELLSIRMQMLMSMLEEVLQKPGNNVYNYMLHEIGYNVPVTGFLLAAHKCLKNVMDVEKYILPVKYMESDAQHENCSICFEDEYTKSNYMVETICKHKFHKDCLKKWLNEKETCPCCRNSLSENPSAAQHDDFAAQHDDEEAAAQNDIIQYLNSLYAERDAIQEFIEPTEEERAMGIVGII